MTDIAITPSGPFSLREAAMFGFGHRHETMFDGVMRLAFVLDGYTDQVAAEVRQDADGTVRIRLVNASAAQRDRAVTQVSRVLSLDHDGAAFERICRADPVLAQLVGVAPGLRPVLFYSPYEAAVWAVLSARRAPRQAAALRERLAHVAGRTFTLAGQQLAALPTPTQLLAVSEVDGLPAIRLGWLHGIADAAQSGQLDAGTLAATDPDEAMAGLRRLSGIGPFYAALIQIRSTGAADVEVAQEPRLRALLDQFYPGVDPVQLGEAWRPYRTWASVLVRAAGPRLLAGVGAGAA